MGAGCSKDGAYSKDEWPTDFNPTALSSNKCDALWEDIVGKPACFAMGCHWGPTARFGAVPGVIRAISGFGGGMEPDPSYSDPKDHYEVIALQYDPEKVQYEELLRVFWTFHDWHADMFIPYGSIIFYHDETQKDAAEASLEALKKKTKQKIQTTIKEYKEFWPVPDRYQHYLLQQNKKLFHRLGIPETQLGYSHLACKVEGYLCGYGKPEKFDDEVPELYLPPELAKAIRILCIKNQRS